jgi:hypothetical protein
MTAQQHWYDGSFTGRSWNTDSWSKWLVQVHRVARSEVPYGARRLPAGSKRMINRRTCQAMMWL